MVMKLEKWFFNWTLSDPSLERGAVMCSGRRQAQGCIWPWLWHLLVLAPCSPRAGRWSRCGASGCRKRAISRATCSLTPLLLGRLAHTPFMGFRLWICREQLLQRARRCSEEEYKRERQSWAATGARLSLCSEKSTVHEQCVHAVRPAGECEVKGKSWFERRLRAVM